MKPEIAVAIWAFKRYEELGNTIRARMRVNMQLLGTSLKLAKGQLVELTPATNLPPPERYKFFARALHWKEQDSILVSLSEVDIII
jgi:hypothetical protein